MASKSTHPWVGLCPTRAGGPWSSPGVQLLMSSSCSQPELPSSPFLKTPRCLLLPVCNKSPSTSFFNLPHCYLQGFGNAGFQIRLFIPLEMALVKGDVSVSIASVLYPGSSGRKCDFPLAVSSHTGGTASGWVWNGCTNNEEDFTLYMATLVPGP